MSTPNDSGADPRLTRIAHRVLDTTRYLVLGTVEQDGSARVSPVYFTHDGYRDLYWVSSPLSTHSQNLQRDPRVSIVVFDSTVLPRETQAVYVTGSAAEVPAAGLEDACRRASAGVGEGASAFTADEVSGAAPLRLYRATVGTAEVHIRGGESPSGSGRDRRLPVTL
jgi:nitroimidazol reductase NimA-like FMN-containing flavoprotein (pyridoxamine 5'-phosphate oxidase superfamily)